MTTSFFYCKAERSERNSELIRSLESLSAARKKQIYLIDRPLGDSKYSYAYTDALVLLVPNHKIVFINTGSEGDAAFEEFIEDFLEDLGSISDKFRYKEIIGRPRSWKDNLTAFVHVDRANYNLEKMLEDLSLDTGDSKKKCELLISLLTGSINDIDRIKGSVPENILDKIKQKIILFDGEQTRFVYQKPEKKRITIQGLSGTGKTELLLHKLKEIYIESTNSKIIFTCHNKILADSLRTRIPDFFNFMKVEEQIKWDERLWCVNAWGSKYKKDTGTYSYICDFYRIPFLSFTPSTNFDFVCKKAISEINSLADREFCFDFMLIDESQDFPPSFFELCELVTRNTVYVAGDIFQSIFDDNIIRQIEPDYLLSKCYRTDPKTLMFAHALGMGLFEHPKLRWLNDNEWKACGYIVNKNDEGTIYELSREPLRRFEDLEQSAFSSIELVKTNPEDENDVGNKILQIIASIREENPTVLADDIGVIFIDNNKSTYWNADKLQFTIPREFGWEVNKAYESKERIEDTLFISNKNNVKGLEFPFVICVTLKIQNSRSYRNALYMMLTRSFLRSYLLMPELSNSDLIERIESGLVGIRTEGVLRITPPSEEEKREIVTAITYTEESISHYDFVEKAFDNLEIPPLFRKDLYEVIKRTIGETFDYNSVCEIIDFNFSRMHRE